MPPWPARRTWRRWGRGLGRRPGQPRRPAGGGRGRPRRTPGPTRHVRLTSCWRLALRLTEGYAAAAPTLTQALAGARPGRRQRRGRPLALAGWGRATVWLVALELWDADSWHALATAQARFARDTGALVQLQYALNFLAMPTCSPASSTRRRGCSTKSA